MGATFTPVQGYLAGIYRTPGHLISSVNTHQLMLNPTFDVGALTSWTDDCAGASSATATANYGWKERSYGVVMVDDGSNLCGISQIRTLDEAMPSDQTSYRIIASCWIKFAASGKTATLKVSGLDGSDVETCSGTVTMVSAHAFYGDQEWGYFSVAVDAVATTKKVKVEVYSSGTSQTYYIDRVSAVIVDQCAGAFGPISLDQIRGLKDITTFATGNGGFRTLAPVLEEEAVINVPSYYVASVRSAVSFTGSGLNDATASGTYTGHVHTTYRIQIDGAGTPDTFKWSKDGGATWEATTAAITGAAQSLDNGVSITFAADTGHTADDYWDITVTPHEGVGAELGAGTKVFVVLWTQKGTVTEDRWEFWAYANGINWSSPIGEVQREDVTLTVDGIVGYADR